MDALASADNVLEQNDATRAAPPEADEPSHSQPQTGEDNKFQQAISSWRSTYLRIRSSESLMVNQ